MDNVGEPPDSDAPMCIGFAPIAVAGARVLILGSMPGVASLKAQQYYAHPRNQFWPIIGALTGAGPELAYPARIERLQAARIAVWDVLKACERTGSLDSAIRSDTEVANDFATFFEAQPELRLIVLNGGKAALAFRRHVAPACSERLGRIVQRVMPSTSAAHAGRSFAQKLAEWSNLCDFL